MLNMPLTKSGTGKRLEELLGGGSHFLKANDIGL
jgi:hypothetical protein